MTVERTDGNLPAQQPRTPVSLSRPLTDIDQAWRMAQALAGSSLLWPCATASERGTEVFTR